MRERERERRGTDGHRDHLLYGSGRVTLDRPARAAAGHTLFSVWRIAARLRPSEHQRTSPACIHFWRLEAHNSPRSGSPRRCTLYTCMCVRVYVRACGGGRGYVCPRVFKAIHTRGLLPLHSSRSGTPRRRDLQRPNYRSPAPSTQLLASRWPAPCLCPDVGAWSRVEPWQINACCGFSQKSIARTFTSCFHFTCS